MNNADRLKRLLKETVTPYLKNEGFKKKGASYRYNGGDFMWIIDFTRPWHNTQEKTNVDIDWGVYVPCAKAVIRAIHQRPMPESPKTDDDCLYGGMAMFPGVEGSFQLCSDDPPDFELRVGQRVVDEMRDCLLPFLQPFDDLAFIAQFITQASYPKDFILSSCMLPFFSDRLMLASIIYHHLGRDAEGRATMVEVFAEMQREKKKIKQSLQCGEFVETLCAQLFPGLLDEVGPVDWSWPSQSSHIAYLTLGGA